MSKETKSERTKIECAFMHHLQISIQLVKLLLQMPCTFTKFQGHPLVYSFFAAVMGLSRELLDLIKLVPF